VISDVFRGGVDLVSVPILAGGDGAPTRPREHFISARSVGDPDFGSLFAGLAATVEQKKAAVLAMTILGGCGLQAQGLRALRDVFGRLEWPVTWVGEPGCPLTGVQVHAVSGAKVEPLFSNGLAVGSGFEDTDATYCVLGGISADPSLPRPLQTRQVFEAMESVLRQADMDFSQVFRTWLFIDRILDWYPAFNAVRTGFFEDLALALGSVPASTGIGLANPLESALVAGALALRPKSPSARVQRVFSPLQCPATDYRSSFSRAVEVALPACRKLFVSGTASIDAEGKTAHTGDIQGQIAQTMEVVQAILESRRMSWSNVTRAIAYVTHPDIVARFEEYCATRRLPRFPFITTQAVICRGDLLFEVEVDAVAA